MRACRRPRELRARGGLPPVEVERMITRPIEETVSTVNRLKNMYSNSREAESRVTLEFEPGTDMKFAGLEVREKFSRVKAVLPSEIEKPVIANFEETDAAILIFAVTSATLAPERIRVVVDQELKPQLDRVD
ncbi:MAG: efflux RND transporter permease subunit, partial [Gemmatimonadota bacterium]